MSEIAKCVLALLLAVSTGACNQTINPHGGPVVTNIPGAGLFVDEDCVARDIVIADPVTGESKPVRQRFCGGRPMPTAHRLAAAPPLQNASARKSSTQDMSARDTHTLAKKKPAPANLSAQPSDIPNSPPVQGFE